MGNDGIGVYIGNGADNHIGGYQSGNVISGGNWDGVRVFGSEGTTVGANLIGLDVTGSSAIPNAMNGLGIFASTTTTVGGSVSTVRNIISGNIEDGILVKETGSTATEIYGNFIGIDIAGASAVPNGSRGVAIVNAPNGVAVGGASSGSGNLISGNGAPGILVYSGENVTIQGNMIGSDVAGSYAIPNTSGVGVFGTGVLVGGTGPLEGNLISGNTSSGIWLRDAGSLTIQGNRVGTRADGTGALGNGNAGIDFNVTTDGLSVIGGTGSAANTVAFNGGAGMALVSSSYVEILPNSVHSNVGLGIDLGSDGVTLNDAGDGDWGPNYLQNFPVISGVTRGVGDVTIEGALNGEANHDFEIQFYQSSSCDSSGYGEGEIYLGYSGVSTDAGGDAVFNVTLQVTVPDGAFISATATRLEGFWGATSEFSACFQVIDLDSSIFADGFESGNTTAWN